MKKISLLLVLISFASACYCCSCRTQATIKTAFKRSDAVFTGTVIAKKDVTWSVIRSTGVPGEPNRIYARTGIQFTFHVHCVFKGKKMQDTVMIVTGVGNGDCGYKFIIGVQYLVYSYFPDEIPIPGKEIHFLYTDICTRTQFATDEEELKKLEKISRLTTTLPADITGKYINDNEIYIDHFGFWVGCLQRSGRKKQGIVVNAEKRQPG